ncbi:MAG: diacylglycerol/lipid kinase family protein [Anaerovoracaceae bacterium]|jgi:YegS/Rv2252/BmrU family lipid kinase
MQKALLLMNGSAGRAQVSQETYRIIEKMALAGYRVTVCPVEPSRGLRSEEVIVEEGEKFDLITCAGGDGTLNHVINAMMKIPQEKRPRMGYIPAGSTNDFARSLEIPTEVGDAVDVITGGAPFRYDLGKFNDRYFNYIAAFGAFSAVSYSTSQNFKNAFGHAAYILRALTTFQKNVHYSCHMQITTEDFEEESDYVFGAIYNTMSVGGFQLKDNVQTELDDGYFEMLLVKAPRNVLILNQIALKLLNGDLNDPHVTFHKVKHAKIVPDKETGWALDGEYGGSPSEINFEVCPRAIELMVPDK